MSFFVVLCFSFFYDHTATPESYTYLPTLSLHDALPISRAQDRGADRRRAGVRAADVDRSGRSVGLRLDPAAPRLGLSARDRALVCAARPARGRGTDRKSTRLNSSH